MTTRSRQNKTNTGPYMDFFTDFAFKKLLGLGNEKQLIHLLNALFKRVKHSPLKDLEYLPTEKLGVSKEDRNPIFRCHMFSPRLWP